MEEYSGSNCCMPKYACVVFECGCRCFSVTGQLCIKNDYFIVKDCCHKVYHIRKEKVVYFMPINQCCC